MQLHMVGGAGDIGGLSLSIRCPSCKQIGIFNSVGLDIQFSEKDTGTLQAGRRVCPNPKCKALIFVVINSGRLLVAYPPERLDFDSTNVPQSITESLEEAITCHASQCFVAAAIMMRKTLETLCSVQGASGGNLKQRIAALGSKVVLPPDLLTGLDDLRLLGNDAAHIESQVYAKVSQEEVEVGIEFTKEVLKAIYQYSALLARLQALKKQP